MKVLFTKPSRKRQRVRPEVLQGLQGPMEQKAPLGERGILRKLRERRTFSSVEGLCEMGKKFDGQDTRTQTARPWKTTKTTEAVLKLPKPKRLLDFGSGAYISQVLKLRDLGYDIDGFDLYWDDELAKVEGIYHPGKPPPRGGYDMIMASNVINVQTNTLDLEATLDEMKKYLAPGGTLVLNYPGTPRKMKPKAWSPKEMWDFVESHYGAKTEKLSSEVRRIKL